jgi:hypothetical protein
VVAVVQNERHHTWLGQHPTLSDYDYAMGAYERARIEMAALEGGEWVLSVPAPPPPSPLDVDKELGELLGRKPLPDVPKRSSATLGELWREFVQTVTDGATDDLNPWHMRTELNAKGEVRWVDVDEVVNLRDYLSSVLVPFRDQEGIRGVLKFATEQRWQAIIEKVQRIEQSGVAVTDVGDVLIEDTYLVDGDELYEQLKKYDAEQDEICNFVPDGDMTDPKASSPDSEPPSEPVYDDLGRLECPHCGGHSWIVTMEQEVTEYHYVVREVVCVGSIDVDGDLDEQETLSSTTIRASEDLNPGHEIDNYQVGPLRNVRCADCNKPRP